jgi:hypothetical protein
MAQVSRRKVVATIATRGSEFPANEVSGERGRWMHCGSKIAYKLLNRADDVYVRSASNRSSGTIFDSKELKSSARSGSAGRSSLDYTDDPLKSTLQ